MAGRDREDCGRARRAQAAGGPGLRPGRRYARAVRRTHQERDRALGQGRARREYPGGVGAAMCIPLRNLAVWTALALAGTISAHAQTYPDRPVKLIVPFAPAGPVDVVAR